MRLQRRIFSSSNLLSDFLRKILLPELETYYRELEVTSHALLSFMPCVSLVVIIPGCSARDLRFAAWQR